MELFGQRVGQLKAEDIRRVVETHAPETRTLDFKRAWPRKDDGGKGLKDLALDLVAMANTAGGVILVGIQERALPEGGDSGAADELSGCGPSFDFDVEMPRLQSILRTLVEPALVGLVAAQHVPLDGVTGGVLALGVPASPVRPHLMRDPFRIPRRAERANVDPDISELRQMFSEATTWRDRGDQVLQQEIARAQGNNALLGAGGPLLLLELIPVDPYAHRLTMRDHYDALMRQVIPFGNDAPESSLGGYNAFRYTATGLRRESQKVIDTFQVTPWACAVEKDGSFREWCNIGWSNEFAVKRRGLQAYGFLDAELLGWALVSHIRTRAAMMRELLHVEGPLLLLIAWHGVANLPLVLRGRGQTPVSSGSYGDWLTAPVELLTGDAGTDLDTSRRCVETLWNAAGFEGLDPATIAAELKQAGIAYTANDWHTLSGSASG